MKNGYNKSKNRPGRRKLHPLTIFRSGHQRYSVRKGVLRNIAKFTGKYLCQRLSFNKVAN